MAQTDTSTPIERGAFPVPEVFHDRPAPATLVYLALTVADRPLRVEELAEATGRPTGTIRNALRSLVEDDVVDKRRALHDTRRKVYSLSDTDL